MRNADAFLAGSVPHSRYWTRKSAPGSSCCLVLGRHFFFFFFLASFVSIRRIFHRDPFFKTGPIYGHSAGQAAFKVSPSFISFIKSEKILISF